MRNIVIYLEDILKAMNDIEVFVEGLEYDDFMKDDKTKSAVVRQLEVIGEAARPLPEDLLKKHADIPWEDMVGMRNVLIHQYFGVDYSLVWKAIKKTIPEVKEKIEKIIKEVKP